VAQPKIAIPSDINREPSHKNKNIIKNKSNNQNMPEQLSEEQVKALQEKIKQMSPEELKEFQKKQCIFCQIISGRVQSKRVFEDDKTLAILDINPANPGHILLLPKEHYTIMPQLPEDVVGHMFMAAKALSNSLLRGIGAQGANIIAANGVAAGQRAQHFMMHIIPRMEEDDLQFVLPQHSIPEEKLEEIRKKLSKSLGEMKETSPETPPPFVPPKREVVEAEFKEDVPKKEQKKRKPKKSTKKETEGGGESINLDDISKILGAK
jgi:histidine triad (HIT) family protein